MAATLKSSAANIGRLSSFLDEKGRAYLATPSRPRLTKADLDDIIGDKGKIPQGRVGNLTPFQEGKLREMWLLACRAFGVYEGETLEIVNTLAANAPRPVSDTPAAAPAKKARGGFFSRKKKEDEAPVENQENQSTFSEPINLETLALEDDKHGSNKSFKAAMSSFSGDELREAFWQMVKLDHPDAILLRFLRARKWDVKAAFVMAVGALHWRLVEYKVDSDIMRVGEAGAVEMSKSSDPATKKEGLDFLAQFEVGKNMFIGMDKEGRPISTIRVKLHKTGENSVSSVERFTVYSIETFRLVLRPPTDTATIIFDMTDFGLANMDYAPVKFMIKCFEANYPESLGAIFIHKAPWIFSSIWGVIKGWLDPVVASKVHFTKDLNQLTEHVSLEQLPQSLGGKLKYDWKYIPPVEGENAKLLDTETRDKLIAKQKDMSSQFEEATIEWVVKSLLHARGDHPEITKDVVDESMDNRHRLARDLRDNYWAMDPYIRARSFYDRIGRLGSCHAERGNPDPGNVN